MTATAKPFPWKCGACRKRAVSPAVLPAYSAALDHDGRSYPITLANFRVLRCERCKSLMLDDEANRKLSDALRERAGLLMPSEIRERREAIGLALSALAGRLGIEVALLHRWEAGIQIQPREMDDRLRREFAEAEAPKGGS